MGETLLAVAGPASPRELMILTRENEQFRWRALSFQSRIVALTLLEWAPKVILGMDDQSGRRNIRRVHHRTLRSELGDIRPRVLVAEKVPDVTRADKSNGIEESVLNDRRSEAMIVRRDPRRQVSPVRTAHDAESGPVELRMLRNNPLQEVDDIVEINRAHRTPDGPRVILPVPRSPPRITEHDRVPGVSVDLELVHHRHRVRGERTPVDIQ